VTTHTQIANANRKTILHFAVRLPRSVFVPLPLTGNRGQLASFCDAIQLVSHDTEGHMYDAQNRREFLGHLSLTSAAIVTTGSLAPYPRTALPRSTEKWDTSWIDALKTATYHAVIDANVLEEGYAPDLANGLLLDFREVHGAEEKDVRIVIVARRGGTPLVFGDATWERLPVGEDTKMNDRSTNAPYRRNPFYRPRSGASPESSATKLENLQKRGVILLVCNIALTNWSRGLAEKTKRGADDVYREVRADLVPGTIVMPSGVFAIMRAQNASCAYMRGQ
jgi:hypothetical protein